jgi:hypothetical protein
LYDFTQFREPSLPKLGKIIQFFLFFVVFREKSDEIRRNLTRFRVFVTHFWEQNRITQSREPSYYCFGSLKKMSKKKMCLPLPNGRRWHQLPQIKTLNYIKLGLAGIRTHVFPNL